MFFGHLKKFEFWTPTNVNLVENDVVCSVFTFDMRNDSQRRKSWHNSFCLKMSHYGFKMKQTSCVSLPLISGYFHPNQVNGVGITTVYLYASHFWRAKVTGKFNRHQSNFDFLIFNAYPLRSMTAESL